MGTKRDFLSSELVLATQKVAFCLSFTINPVMQKPIIYQLVSK